MDPLGLQYLEAIKAGVNTPEAQALLQFLGNLGAAALGGILATPRPQEAGPQTSGGRGFGVDLGTNSGHGPSGTVKIDLHSGGRATPAVFEQLGGFGSGLRIDLGTSCSMSGNDKEKDERAPKITKAQSPIWKGLTPYKGKTRTSGAGGNRQFYQWDNTHGDIEVYDNRGNHLGSMNALTGAMHKPAVPGRTITP